MKKIIFLLLYIILVFLGILTILKSNSWGYASILSMNLAGSILSIFGIIGIFMELYFKKDINNDH